MTYPVHIIFSEEYMNLIKSNDLVMKIQKLLNEAITDKNLFLGYDGDEWGPFGKTKETVTRSVFFTIKKNKKQRAEIDNLVI